MTCLGRNFPFRSVTVRLQKEKFLPRQVKFLLSFSNSWTFTLSLKRIFILFSEGKPQYYRGIGGKSMEIAVNYMKLEQAEGYGIFEYEVRFDPPVDSRAERYR